MTDNQENLIRRFAWLCAELSAGNGFSRETLMGWYDRAMKELSANEVHKVVKWTPETARQRVGGTFGT